jgi:hypothetical protein
MLAMTIERLGIAGELFLAGLQRAAIQPQRAPDEVVVDMSTVVSSFVDAVGLLVVADMTLNEVAYLGLSLQDDAASPNIGPMRGPWSKWVEAIDEQSNKDIRDATIRLDFSVHEARNRCVAHVEVDHYLTGRWSGRDFQLMVLGATAVDQETIEALIAIGTTIPDLESSFGDRPNASLDGISREVQLRAPDLDRERRKRLKGVLKLIGFTVVPVELIVDDLLFLTRSLSPGETKTLRASRRIKKARRRSR